ncbi:hypothetical protein CXB51_025618 [Gossypium anomalum]|uniref:RING-type E3 ubiquitin transferase n=1 Tax=Gossypium anomalum TaxID=47600 RepID=A0A8J6CSM3_9ROSI|nr:hypothetical protein CXB51_025618 [Gossypium anomalum]
MDSPSSSPKPLGKSNIQRFIRRVISPAIVAQNMSHMLENHRRSWSGSSHRLFPRLLLGLHPQVERFEEELPSLQFHLRFLVLQNRSLLSKIPQTAVTCYLRLQIGLFHDLGPPIIERTRREINNVNRRTRPLPWRRSFGRPGTVSPHVIAERKLQWRASVYNRRLQAVPIYHGNGFQQNVPRIRNDFEKEKLLQRIEPWIQRELEAILGDPDPSIILHVFPRFSSLDMKESMMALLPLRHSSVLSMTTFLLLWNLFCTTEPTCFGMNSEMYTRCFVESPFTMETYDAVVEYR